MNTDTINENVKGEKKTFFLRRIQNRITNAKSSYLVFCFIVPAILMYLLYLVREIHPFGDGSVLVLDLNAQYVYFFESLRNFVYGDADLLYSFSRALGGEFVGIYAYYIASPLSYIVALFPKHRILEALLTLFILKVGLCGYTFGFYLHKNSKNTNKIMVVAFSVMYSLCAYAVIHQNNTMWIDALIWLPLLTLGIEHLVKFGKYKLFVISLALTIWSNFYIGYMVCIYVAAYFFFYLYAYGDGRNNPRGEKAHKLRSFIRIAVFSAIGVAISAFIILGAYYSLGFGKNEFSNPNWSLTAKFNALDFLTKFLPSSYDTVRPEGIPFVYTGVLTLILVPIFFMSKKIPLREKLASGALIGFFVISFFASTLDLIWHGFQVPNWLNARYSFLFCFFLLVLAYKGFGNLRRVSEKTVLAISAFIVLFVAVCEKQTFKTYVESEEKLLTFECIWLTIIVTCIFLAILCSLVKVKKVKTRESLSAILAVVVCIEIVCSSISCMVQFDKDVLYSGYSGYNDFLTETRSITETVQENDKGFYRMEKVDQRRLNDNMALATFGLSGSTSTLNADTIKFLHLMGYSSSSHWSQYYGGNPVSDSLLGIKYVIDRNNSKFETLYGYSPEYVVDNNTAYLNPYALSLAYGVDSSVKDFDPNSYDSHFVRLNSLISDMLGEEETLNVFTSIPIEDSSVKYASVSQIEGHTKYAAEKENDASVSFTITAPKDGEILFYAPSRYTRKTTLSVNSFKMDNGKKTNEKNANLGDYFEGTGDRIFSLGSFSKGDTVVVTLKLASDDLYLKTASNYFYYIDDEVFADAFARLKANPQYSIDENFKQSHLTGTIRTEKDSQTIFTSIPYDKGWHIIVDGKEVETYEVMNALIAFDIDEAGDHTLEMKYFPTAYKLGLTISLAGIIVFIAIMIFELISKALFRKFMKLEESDCEDTLWLLEDFDEDAEQELLLTEEERNGRPLKDIFSEITHAVSNFFNTDTSAANSDDNTNNGTKEQSDDKNKDNGEK